MGMIDILYLQGIVRGLRVYWTCIFVLLFRISLAQQLSFGIL